MNGEIKHKAGVVWEVETGAHASPCCSPWPSQEPFPTTASDSIKRVQPRPSCPSSCPTCPASPSAPIMPNVQVLLLNQYIQYRCANSFSMYPRTRTITLPNFIVFELSPHFRAECSIHFVEDWTGVIEQRLTIPWGPEIDRGTAIGNRKAHQKAEKRALMRALPTDIIFRCGTHPLPVI